MPERLSERKIHVVDLARLRAREAQHDPDDTGELLSPWSTTECSCCVPPRKQ
jgi:hypothetical protein